LLLQGLLLVLRNSSPQREDLRSRLSSLLLCAGCCPFEVLLAGDLDGVVDG
jgi:hypothetical protein